MSLKKKYNNKKAVVLLSGGLDSTTTLFYALHKGFKAHCLIFDYGQRHKKEIKQAVKIAQKACCRHQVLKICLPWKGSSLLDLKEKIKRNSSKKNIPATYVPARNIIFLSFALSYAEAIKAEAIFIGANEIDFSGYPDCRPEFYKAFSRVIAKGTRAGAENKKIKIFTPLIGKSKAQIIKLGMSLNAPYALTWSCYKGGDAPCGQCDSCYFRAKGFAEAEIKDPLR